MTRRSLLAMAAFPMAAQTPTPNPQYKPGDLLFVNQSGNLQRFGTHDEHWTKDHPLAPVLAAAASIAIIQHEDGSITYQNWDGSPIFSNAEYKAQYAICKQRGHAAGSAFGSTILTYPEESNPWNTCQYCRTRYRTVTTEKYEEEGAPK